MKAIINSADWDGIQNKVRDYVKAHPEMEVTPEQHLTLEYASCVPLSLYPEKGASISIADFSPYYQKDGKTVKHIKVEYEERAPTARTHLENIFGNQIDFNIQS